ncbi:hypothetical protein PHYPO_G00134950 [Pangasianodon hypophthalmus]|uniref:Homeobox domain-containing protein n=1 Tax=Pangasianodon hypophthalmus TaxID=310915 RepID=A0A5N5KKP5_PANHP|nr:homeobox protein NOBOX [Pangasianodon hypophthalmus]KAB5530925.1 hypothetical protein PHYPO_G00134950 [Pangasianodon hypophthalmus]
MAEDSLFASDYGSLCPLCEEEGERPCLALGVHEQQRNVDEEAELKRDHKISSIHEEKKEEGSEKAETVTKGFVETDDEYNHEEGAEIEMGEKVEITEDNKSKHDDGKGNDVSGALVPPPQEEKCVLRLDSGGPVNLVMVCEESVESGINEELLLCPAKSLTLSQTPLISSPPSQNPLALTLTPSNPSVLQLQTQPVVQTQGSVPQAPCLSKRVYGSSPSVEPKTITHPGQLEVTLQQVYTTRRYTRFTSRTAPLKSVHPETSSQPLPCVSNTSLLAPAPKKKTRTSYSTDQLEELERMFQDDHYPDADKRKEIAISVGVTPQRVMVWFQNRRAKWRKTSKTTAKKPPVTRTQAPSQAPVPRPPVFTGPTIAPLPPQTGNTLPPYSTLLTGGTSPPDCVDVATTVSQGSTGDYKHPLMQSPPPLRRASLPFFAAYNPPTHTLSVLLDTPEHSEPQSFSMHTDTGFNYDSVGSSAKYEAVASGPGNTQSYQLMTYPQQSSTLLPQQHTTLLPQQSNNILPQQPNTLLPQYSRVSYLTPSPYLTPNSSEGTATSCVPLNPGTGSSLLPCTNGGHAYFQCQNGSQILLQPGLQALQAYPWTGDMYSHSVQVPHAVLKPQFPSHGHESHYPPLVPPQSYITPQGPSCPSLAKPATPDPLLASVKTELEETAHSQPAKDSEAETIFHCDFSPIHF